MSALDKEASREGDTSLDTVLFDLDGTLIDSIELIRASFAHALAVHGRAPVSHAEWLAGMGTPLAVQFAPFCRSPAEVDALIATYREHNLAHHDQRVVAFPGALAAVRALARRGMTLGVVTSKRSDSARRGIRLCGFDGLFQVVVASDDVHDHKPDPAPVVLALERLGARARTAVFVGDSPHDLAAGRAAGVRTGAVLWGPFPRAWLERESPDLWLATPHEIAHLA